MMSSKVEGCVVEESFVAKGGDSSKRHSSCWMDIIWLKITADDDLIHNAHYSSLEMLIIS